MQVKLVIYIDVFIIKGRLYYYVVSPLVFILLEEKLSISYFKAWIFLEVYSLFME